MPAPRCLDGKGLEDGELYDTVARPTGFVSPPEHGTDPIYSFMMSGLGGQRSIAGSAPGDPDFNGGRWDVSMVVFTPAGIEAHDPDGGGIANFELTATRNSSSTSHSAIVRSTKPTSTSSAPCFREGTEIHLPAREIASAPSGIARAILQG